MKKVYESIRTTAPDLEKGDLEIQNLYDFQGLGFVTGKWEIKADDRVLKKGKLPTLDIAPGKSRKVSIDFWKR